MRRHARVTIAGSMGVVVLVAFAMASLRHPTPLLVNTVYSLTFAILFGAVVAIVCLRGRARAAWVGFAICGWSHFILSLGPWRHILGPRLLTTALIDLGVDYYVVSNGIYGPIGRLSLTGPYSARKYWSGVPDVPPFELYLLQPDVYQTGQCLFSLAIALLGGLFALVITRGQQPNDVRRDDASQRSTPSLGELA